MHLDGQERARGMRRVAPGGRLFVALRHGPVSAGRRMFELSAGEVVAEGAACGLSLVYQGERENLHGLAGVWWSNLVLERRAAGGGLAQASGLAQVKGAAGKP